MLRHFRTWGTIIPLGSSIRLLGQISVLFRYCVIKTVADEGILDYLKEPRTYGEILARFGYIDTDYARALLDILAADDHPVILKQGDKYVRNPAEQPPTLEQVIAQTDERTRGFASMANGLVTNIPKRLRGQPTEFSATFDTPSREMIQNFDAGLGHKLYSINRSAAFALLKTEEFKGLHGKKLLDVGCGGGRETADLWLRFGGDIHIVAVDPVESLVQFADERFESYVKEQDPNHPPITSANRPKFEVGSATQLPFEDGEFDAAFYAHILHWTSDPRKAVREIARVVKPGGLIFGAQVMRSQRSRASVWGDLIARSNESCHGAFWPEEHTRWYLENQFECETVTPMGIFRATGKRAHEPTKLPVPQGEARPASVPQPQAQPAPVPEPAIIQMPDSRPELEALKVELTRTVAGWRASSDAKFVKQYHDAYHKLRSLGWTGELSADDQLPEALMPQEYLDQVQVKAL